MLPIISYGIVCANLTSDGYKFLIVQRRDTYAYIDFILGNYSLNDSWKISQLFMEMVPNEKFRLLKYSFDDLWRDFLCEKPLEDNRKKYDQCVSKYRRISEFIPYLVRRYPSNFRTTDWGFPKGRRHKEERYMHTAFREFFEETGIHPSMTLINRKPLIETYRGTDGKLYKTVYWLTVCNDINPPSPKFIKTHNAVRGYCISDEVSDIKWVTLTEAKRYINDKRLEILQNAIQMLNSDQDELQRENNSEQLPNHSKNFSINEPIIHIEVDV